MKRWARWLSLLVALACLAKNLFGRSDAWSLSGFFAAGAAWYYLTWRRTRELDSPRPR
ncbi:MAG: hypothetical protein KGO96_11190 [Elusimicrobia bacterium]|nr:hypothetical protein [Elusimicrobiota bacterium]MDE2237357.1 hypothetical protein [Elusimicrobiota bacterium]MDE2426457.1 hypothetical protein [Elusimicrobiota bacterium]